MADRTPREAIEFLARSGHRVAVLDALADGERSRRALHEATGVSQPTLGRVLNDFEGRGWVVRRNGTVALTPFGAVLATQFADLLGTVETMQRFRDVAPYLPLNDIPFDLRAFGTATITTPHAGDVLAHVRRGEELLAAADRVRVLTPSVHPQALRELAERLPEREQQYEAIIAAAALDTALAEPELAAIAREALASDTVSVHRYEGPIPLSVGLADDRALLFPLGEHDVPCALVEATDDPMRRWVVERLDAARERATEITAADLTV